jgi:hypothetical protein
MQTDTQTPGTRTDWFVIPCGRDKVDAPTSASDLYTGTMFRNTLNTAREQVSDENILVLSALHGLVRLTDVLAPYDVKMGDADSVTAETVVAQAALLGMNWGDGVYALLPKAYLSVLDSALRELFIYTQDVYEVCAGIGDQRGVLRCARIAV